MIKYKCDQCGKLFKTLGGYNKHYSPFGRDYRNKNRRKNRCDQGLSCEKYQNRVANPKKM